MRTERGPRQQVVATLGKFGEEDLAAGFARVHGVGRQTQSAGQRTVKVSLVHEGAEVIATAVTFVSNE